jgi:hypothetical protein
MRTVHDSIQAWRQDAPRLEAAGVFFPPSYRAYITPDMKVNERFAMDAQASLTTTANSDIPNVLNTWIDPEIVNIVFAPQEAEEILPKKRIGDWTTGQAMIPVVEGIGEVTGYGDFEQTGAGSLNVNFPQRQNYLWQVVIRYGDLQVEKMGLARINYVSSIQKAAAEWLNRYGNYVDFYGVKGLQNYGILNDPSLPSTLTPATKANGNGNVWMYNGAPNATANEVFADIQTLFWQLATQTQGLIKSKDKMILALGPGPAVAFATTNSFGLTAASIIEKNFPNLKIVTAPQYEKADSNFIEGYSTSGNFCQLIAETLGGEPVGNTTYSDKLRAHRLVPDTSFYRQKWSSASFGSFVKRPVCFASMLGI